MQNDQSEDEYGERVLDDGTTEIYDPKNDDAWIISDTVVPLANVDEPNRFQDPS